MIGNNLNSIDALGSNASEIADCNHYYYLYCFAIVIAALDTAMVTAALRTTSEHFHSKACHTRIAFAYLLPARSSTVIH